MWIICLADDSHEMSSFIFSDKIEIWSALYELNLNSSWTSDICPEVLQPSQPNGVMLSTVSLSNHTFTGQAKFFKRLTSIVHILSPETDWQLPFLNQLKFNTVNILETSPLFRILVEFYHSETFFGNNFCVCNFNML